MLLVDAFQGSIVFLQLLDCLLLLVYLLSTFLNRSILITHLLYLLLQFILSCLQRLLSEVNLLLLLMYVHAFKLETLVHVAFFIYVLTDVFGLDLLKNLLCWFGSAGGRLTRLND